jgi:LysM repeat protein
MKKIALWLLMFGLTAPLAFAQESATQQQLDELRGHLQDAQEALRLQDQRIAALEKEIGELRDKVNAPAPVGEPASNADLKKLAEQVQEIDQKRADDREVILKQIDILSKAVANAPVPVAPSHRTSSAPKSSGDDGAATASGATMAGHEYKIQQGDTLGLIVKAYREKGVKVTKSQVIKANPGINPDVLIPGKVLFIPDPAAK